MDDWESDLVPQRFETTSEMHLCTFCNAAQDGDIEKLKRMLKEKIVANVNQQSPIKKETALHYACRSNQLDIIKFLIEEGADVNLRDVRGKHSLHLSSSGGHYEAVDYLIKQNAKLDVVDKYGRSCLHWAAGNQHYDTVVRLLEAGAPITYTINNNWQPLHEAVKGGDVRILEYLIERGAPVNPPIVNYTMKSTVSPLHVAAREGKTECLKLLLKHKASVNAINQGRKTPLHEAAFKGAKDCCHQLLLYGADPRARDNLDRSPLLEACYKGHMHCAILLLDAGSPVNRPDRAGDTALHHLLRHNQERLEPEKLAAFTDVLLQYGANPNLVGMEDDTAHVLASSMVEKDVLDVIFTAMGMSRLLVSGYGYLPCQFRTFRDPLFAQSLWDRMKNNVIISVNVTSKFLFLSCSENPFSFLFDWTGIPRRLHFRRSATQTYMED